MVCFFGVIAPCHPSRWHDRQQKCWTIPRPSHCKNSLAGHGSECGESHDGTSASVWRASKARSSDMSSSGTLCSPASPHVVDQLGFTIRGDVETMRLKFHSQHRDILCSGTRRPTRHRAQKPPSHFQFSASTQTGNGVVSTAAAEAWRSCLRLLEDSICQRLIRTMDLVNLLCWARLACSLLRQLLARNTSGT